MSAIASAPKTNTSAPLTALDKREFDSKFNRKAFMIGHNLSSHPLFDLSRLIELSQTLPPTSIEYNAGDLPVEQDPTQTPRNGLSIEETIRRIEECKSWMVLKNVEQSPAYKKLLGDCLDQIDELIRDTAPGMCRREGFIFISSAGSVTPFHIDPENNFLLQIRGNKHVQMFDVEDRFVMTEAQLEAFFTGAHRNIPFRSEFENHGQWHDLTPGDGLHFPVAAPHWVRNGNDVSISFSITFQTKESERRQSLHRLNSQIRRMGLTPSPFNASPLRDNLKMCVVNAGRCFRKLTGGQKSGSSGS